MFDCCSKRRCTRHTAMQNAQLAWCVTGGVALAPKAPRQALTPRRARRAAVCATHTVRAGHGDKARAEGGAEDAWEGAQAGGYGVLTDSVLEVKWRNEELAGERRDASAADAEPLCGVCDSAGGDLSQSDPYMAFAEFTKIAAPTAALGRDEAELGSHRPVGVPPSDERSNDRSDAIPQAEDRVLEQVRGAEELQLDLPYSAASIARRMMRYVHAKKNLQEFLALFAGEFDNYDQIAAERAVGILPCEGGGHEHIHCSITPLNGDLLFARYYFNGNPSVVFRSRLYRVSVSDSSDRGIIEMRIFRFYEEIERQLKINNYDVKAVEWDDGDVYDWLEGCEVFWERYVPDSVASDEASRTLGIESGPRFVGYMKGGGCELHSREIGGRIRVMDDLLLTSGELWVADRGFDEADNFVYGNRRGIPYKMKRVHPDGPTAWTLSAVASAPEGYIP